MLSSLISFFVIFNINIGASLGGGLHSVYKSSYGSTFGIFLEKEIKASYFLTLKYSIWCYDMYVKYGIFRSLDIGFSKEILFFKRKIRLGIEGGYSITKSDVIIKEFFYLNLAFFLHYNFYKIRDKIYFFIELESEDCLSPVIGFDIPSYPKWINRTDINIGVYFHFPLSLSPKIYE